MVEQHYKDIAQWASYNMSNAEYTHYTEDDAWEALERSYEYEKYPDGNFVVTARKNPEER